MAAVAAWLQQPEDVKLKLEHCKKRVERERSKQNMHQYQARQKKRIEDDVELFKLPWAARRDAGALHCGLGGRSALIHLSSSLWHSGQS